MDFLIQILLDLTALTLNVFFCHEKWVFIITTMRVFGVN